MDGTAFKLDQASGVPFYRQIQDQILAAVATKGLAPGDRLPTVRALAVELSINPNTVARAYRDLEIRGVLTTQQGSGSFISTQPVERNGVEARRRTVQLVDEFLARAAGLGVSVEEICQELDERRSLANDTGLKERDESKKRGE